MMALQCDLMHRHKSDTSAHTQNAPRVGGCACASAGRFATGLIFIFGRHSFSSSLSYRHRTSSAARVGAWAPNAHERSYEHELVHARHIHTTFAIMCTVLRLMQNDIRWRKKNGLLDAQPRLTAISSWISHIIPLHTRRASEICVRLLFFRSGHCALLIQMQFKWHNCMDRRIARGSWNKSLAVWTHTHTQKKWVAFINVWASIWAICDGGCWQREDLL